MILLGIILLLLSMIPINRSKFYAFVIFCIIILVILFYLNDEIDLNRFIIKEPEINGYVSYPRRGNIVTLSDLEKKKIVLTSENPEKIPALVRLSASKIKGNPTPGTYSAIIEGSSRTVTLIVV